MPPIKIKSYPVKVYPPPLADGNPPADSAPDDAPRPSPRGLQAAAVLMLIVTGAWLVRFWIGDDMPPVLQRVGAPFDTLAWALPCAAAWVLLCLLAVARAWRRNQ